jgi:hypothetical protein
MLVPVWLGIPATARLAAQKNARDCVRVGVEELLRD